jgi:hypothetical protein
MGMSSLKLTQGHNRFGTAHILALNFIRPTRQVIHVSLNKALEQGFTASSVGGSPGRIMR